MRRIGATSDRFAYRPHEATGDVVVEFVDHPDEATQSLIASLPEPILPVSDRGVPPRHLAKLKATASRRLLAPLLLPPRRKTLQCLARVWSESLSRRAASLLGVGGGTVCDLTGFAAATIARGIPFGLVPTTTLAMIDAGIGGKTAIDYGRAKNSIGSIVFPRFVLAPAAFVTTLPKELHRTAFSEAVKLAMVTDEPWFLELAAVLPALDRIPLAKLRSLLAKAAKRKASICERVNSTERLILLYGHAVGHAIEMIESGRVGHGTAVGLGMRIEARIAARMNWIDHALVTQQDEVLTAIGIPRRPGRRLRVSTLVDTMSLYARLYRDPHFLLVLPRWSKGAGHDVARIKRRELERHVAAALDDL